MQKGIFIVLDGNDGSGKATQSNLLLTYLSEKGVPAMRIDFPQYEQNLFGALLGDCLAGKEGDFVHMSSKIASVLYAADRFESAEEIRAALNEGTVVVADRYTSSNQIHQGGKIADPKRREEFIAWLDRMEHGVFNIPRPDAVIYMKVPVDTSLALLMARGPAKNNNLNEGELDTVESDRSYLENSVAAAKLLLETQPNWHGIECMKEGELRSIEDIHVDIMRSLEGLLPGVL